MPDKPHVVFRGAWEYIPATRAQITIAIIMSLIIVSHVPTTVSKEKLENFFSFCGQVSLVTKISLEDKFASYEVSFTLPKALLTALLLNDAELDGVPIQVKENDGLGLPSYDELSAKEVSDNKVQTETGDKLYDDVVQEEKPKYAIMAQLLANGYIVGDQVIQHAIQEDKKNGYLQKFKTFLTNLDEKYIHSQDPNSTAGKAVSDAQSSLESTWSSLQSKYGPQISQYLEKAAASPYGVKVNDFYKQVAADVQAVYKEAERLVELKKQQKSAESTGATANTASATAAGATNTPTNVASGAADVSTSEKA